MAPPARYAASKSCDMGSSKVKKGGIMAEPQDVLDLEIGSAVTGTIDGKFDGGYLVTVYVGSERYKGVLYHIPDTVGEDDMALAPCRGRKRTLMEFMDPDEPDSNESGFNVFFAEHYGELKPLHHGDEWAISEKIDVMWNDLTEAEKKIYEEKEVKDEEEIFETEMPEYDFSNNPGTESSVLPSDPLQNQTTDSPQFPHRDSSSAGGEPYSIGAGS